MEILKALREHSDPAQAKLLQRFFKTGPGEYGEGDVFIGVKVPPIRKIVNEFHEKVTIKDTIKILRSPIHEERLLALLLLVQKYKKNINERKEIVKVYLDNTKYINNWDLVDLSAHYILGEHLMSGNRHILHCLAASKDLWERRIAMISTFAFIRSKDHLETLALAKKLINDKEDLIHKAVGWMLREIGKRDASAEEKFLKKHYKKMPRTMLRYAIEKFPEAKRKAYLNGTVQ